MHKHKIIALCGAGIISVVAACWFLQFEGSSGALIERFPDVDPTIVRAVHKEMFREALAGEYSELDLDDDSVCDAIFMAKVMLRTSS